MWKKALLAVYAEMNSCVSAVRHTATMRFSA
jgi:hypothetical protein